MKGSILKSDQGITHDVFKDPEPVEGEDGGEEMEEGGESKPAEDSNDILKQFRHIYVPEVVREPRMHFYRVPKLGSYMAIPLVYNSCLFEDALDNAVQDYLDVRKALDEQNKAKAEWEEEQARIKEDREK